MIQTVAELPRFENDDEMVAWFETADLSGYTLEEALNVVVATRVDLVGTNEPWQAGTNGSPSSPTATLDFELTPSSTPS